LTTKTFFLRRTRKLTPASVTLLNGALNSSATTITVDSTTSYASSGMLKIDKELITYTGKNATQFTTCTRGVDGSVAINHDDNTEVLQVRNEYFYLTAEQLEFGLEKRLIAPILPGNEGADVSGGGDSTNFQFDIGSYQVVIRATGSLFPVDGTNYPSLTPTVNCHVVTVAEFAAEGAEVEGTNNSNTVSGAVTGHYIRSRLVDFIADQAKDGLSLFSLGWPNWGATTYGSSPADTTLNGTPARLFYGRVGNLRAIEVSGELDQSTYSFEFRVGAVEVF